MGSRGAREGKGEAIGVDLFLYFLAVAEDLSFTVAARRFGIDSSWISHKIKELEKKLGCVLFVRTTRRIELTEAGRALVAPARKLAQTLEDTRRFALGLRQGLPQTVTIGSLPHSFWSPKRELIDRFIGEYPEIDVQVRNGPSPLLFRWLRNGDIDLAVVGGSFDASGLEILRLSEERYCMLVPRGHPLEGKSVIRLEDLAGQRIAMMSREHSPQTRRLFSPFLAAGAIPFEVAELERDALVRIAARNQLLALCNVKEVPSYVGTEFVARPVRGAPRNPKYLTRRAGVRTPAIDAFWTMAKRAAEEEASLEALNSES